MKIIPNKPRKRKIRLKFNIWLFHAFSTTYNTWNVWSMNSSEEPCLMPGGNQRKQWGMRTLRESNEKKNRKSRLTSIWLARKPIQHRGRIVKSKYVSDFIIRFSSSFNISRNQREETFSRIQWVLHTMGPVLSIRFREKYLAALLAVQIRIINEQH